MFCRNVFLPTCKNTTSNSRNKLFVRVKETLKMKWCEEVNIDYKPERRLLCCEDHLNLEEDLENYQYYKFMKGKPILKSSAKLRRIQDLPSCRQIETPVAETAPTLKSILQQPIDDLQMVTTIKVEQEIEEIMPTIISATKHVIKIDAAVQCKVETMEKGTSTRSLIQETKSSLMSPISTLHEVHQFKASELTLKQLLQLPKSESLFKKIQNPM